MHKDALRAVRDRGGRVRKAIHEEATAIVQETQESWIRMLRVEMVRSGPILDYFENKANKDVCLFVCLTD